MVQKDWTIETLENRLRIIDNRLSIETNIDKIDCLYEDYELLYYYIQNYYKKEQPTLNLLDGYKQIKEKIIPISFLWNDLLKFKTTTRIPIAKNIPNAKRINLSSEEILELTHDFYKSLNSFFFNYFMKCFKNRNEYLKFVELTEDEYKGETIPISSLQEAFILIKRKHTLVDILTTIHEYSHAMSGLINYKHLFPSKDLFCEIDSIFFELIATDFLEELFKDGNATLIKASSHDSYCYMSMRIASQIKLIKAENNNEFNNNNELKNIAKNICNIKSRDLEELLNYPDLNSSTYIISYSFAIELYKIYLEDKEKALHYLKKIILLEKRTPQEYYNNIQSFGLVPNAHLKKFHQERRDDILRLTRKKPSK